MDQLQVLLVREPLRDPLRATRPDALGFLDLLLRGRDQLVDRSEVRGEVPGRHPARVWDVQAGENTAERHRLLRLLDRSDRVPGRDFRVAVELSQLLLRQAVEIGERGDDALAPEPTDRLLADAVDVPDPVDQGLEPSRLALRVRTAVHRLALGLDDLCPA